MSKSENINSIQALRGIAVMLVVFCHSLLIPSAFFSSHLTKLVGSNNFGSFGVDIFFVVSGFIMVYINQNKFGQKNSAGSFLLKRLVRIFPMYWMVTLIVLFVIIPSGFYAYVLPLDCHTLINAIKNNDHILKSFLLVADFQKPGSWSSGILIWPIVVVGWSLLYEMFFYCIFAIMLMFNRKTYLPILSVIFALLVLANLIVSSRHIHLTQDVLYFLDYYGDSIILEFIFGCFIAEQYLAGKMLTDNVAISTILLSTLFIITSYHMDISHISHFRAIYWGIPSAFIVFGTISLENSGFMKVPKFLVRLGDSSYSIYLTHYSITLILMLSFFRKLNQYVHVPGDLVVFVILFMGIAIGHFAFIYIEKPMVKLIKRALFKPKPTLSSFTLET